MNYTSLKNPSEWLKSGSQTGELYSHNRITLAEGNGVLITGTVLGQITLGSATSAVKASGANTGNGALAMDGAAPLQPNTNVGIYTVRFTSSTAFRVVDPKGAVLGDGVTGTAFADRIKFSVTAGGTPFVAGDGFDITVAAGSGKYVPASATAIDGSQVACAILFDRTVDTTSADQPAVAVTRNATVAHAGLIWGSTITTSGQRAAAVAQLKAVGIIDRQSA